MKTRDQISLSDARDELLKTEIINTVIINNNNIFARKLVSWLIRYIIIISSQNISMKLNLETILLNLHGEKLKKIVQLIGKTYYKMNEDNLQ
jgi:hypothetical protein